MKAFGTLRTRISLWLRCCEQAGAVVGRSRRNTGSAAVMGGAGCLDLGMGVDLGLEVALRL